ncbi:MAG: metallophosphoesterase family protein [Verrucomicrobium sp.]|nr:metallophosphoesterase family protein [Verrucomicrobium sp.]
MAQHGKDDERVFPGGRALKALRIGVIADTHGRIHPRLEALFRDVDEIWHLGDVCEEAVLDFLRGLCPRLTVVLGNNDFSFSAPLTLDLEREGERFHLVHIPPRSFPAREGWFLHGHTHVPRDERIGALRVFNPGSAGLANKGAPLHVGFLEKEPGKPFSARLEPL